MATSLTRRALEELEALNAFVESLGDVDDITPSPASLHVRERETPCRQSAKSA